MGGCAGTLFKVMCMSSQEGSKPVRKPAAYSACSPLAPIAVVRCREHLAIMQLAGGGVPCHHALEGRDGEQVVRLMG